MYKNIKGQTQISFVLVIPQITAILIQNNYKLHKDEFYFKKLFQ